MPTAAGAMVNAVEWMMHQGLDIAISDEASSTVIHVRGPVSARMCDVGCVFDKLGIELISCSTGMPAASSCNMTLVVVDRCESQPLDEALKQSVSEGLHRVLTAHSQQGSPRSRDGSSARNCADVAGAERSWNVVGQQQAALQEVAGSLPGAQQGGSGSSSGRLASLEACRADSASESIPVVGPASADQQEQRQERQQLHIGRQQSWQRADISLLPLPASLLQPRSECQETATTVPAAGEQQQPSVRFSADCTAIPSAAAGQPPPMQRAGSIGRPPKPALKIDIPSDSDSSSSRWNSGSNNNSNHNSSRQPAGGQAAASTGAVSISVPVDRPEQHGQGGLAQDLQRRLTELGLTWRVDNDACDDSSSDDDAVRSVSCRSGGSGSSAAAAAGGASGTKWQRLNSRSCGDLLVLASKQQQHMARAQRASDAAYEAGELPEGQVDCFGTHRSSMDPGLDAQGDSSRSLGSVDQDQPGGSARRPASISPADGVALTSSSSFGRSRRPPPRTPSRIILSPVGPDGSGEGSGAPRLFVSIPKSSSGVERRSRRASLSVAATPRVPYTPASGVAAMTPGSARVWAGLSLKQLSSSVAGRKPGPLSPTVAAAAEAAANMPYNVAVAAAQLLSGNPSTREAAAAVVAAAAEKGDSSTPLPSPPHLSAAAAAATAVEQQRRLSDEGLSPLSPRVPRTSPCSFHQPPATPIHPAVAAAAAAAITAAAESAAAQSHSTTGLELLSDDEADAMHLPACLSPQRSLYRLSGSPGFDGPTSLGTSLDSPAAVAAAVAEAPGTILEGSEGEQLGSEAGGSCSSEEWWCGELTGLTVRDVMTGPVKTVPADADLLQARQLMMQHNLPGMLVDSGPGQAPGILTRTDFFKASSMMRRKGGSRKRPHKPCVRDVMRPALVVDANMTIESCAQALSEAGVRHAAVRDTAAADASAVATDGSGSQGGSASGGTRSSSSMATYVGLVSDAAIFRCLGLYPDDADAGEEELLEEGLLGLPRALRLHSGLDSSFDSSAGTETPLSSRSRVATPLLDSGAREAGAGGGGHHEQQQERQQSASTDAGPSEQQSRQASVLKLPDIVLMREGLGGQGSSAASSLGSGSVGAAPADGSRKGAAGMSDDGANHSGSFALAATASDSSNAALLDVGQGPGSAGAAGEGVLPDALARYKSAAALWEVDMSDLEMIKRIGEGSFGEVMLGTYRGTKVAIKRLRVLDLDDVKAPNEQYAAGGSDSSMRSSSGVEGSSQPAIGASQAAFRQFFEREIAILASIRHPNVVNFIGACHKPGQRCLVTEYCARGSLDQVLHKSGLALDLCKRIDFALDIARGMACLHAQRPIIIHRDLKTANLLVSARFEIKVADFGLSRIKDASHLQVSRAGLEGTIEYCAPEVLRGEPYTEKCDVYSFGVVLWELLLRQRPYSDAEVPVFLLMVNIGNGTLTLPEVPVESATTGLVELVNRCLSFSATDRPEFREVLPILEAEYRALRARQPPRPQQRDHSQQPQQLMPPHQQPLPQHQLHAVVRYDSASSLAVNQQQSPRITADSPDPGSTPHAQSPAGTLGATAWVPPALALAGNGTGEQDPFGVQQQQQPWPPGQQQPLQRHRLSQHDSGLQTASSGGSAAPSFGFGFQPGLQPAPAGTPHLQQLQQHFQVPFGHQQQQVLSVPLPQIQPQQVYVTSTCSSPRHQQPQQFAVPVQHHQQHHQHQQQQYAVPQLRVMSAFPSGSIPLQQQHQQQLQYPQTGYQQPSGPSHGSGGGGGGGCGGTAVKPPRHKQQLSRARSLPTPQSMNWEGLDGEATDTEEQVFEHIQEEAGGGQDVLLFAEDSFGGVSNCSMTGYSPCPSGQLCMLVEPASSTYGSSSAAGILPYQQPQQQVMVTPSGQHVAVQQVPMQPVLIQQPGGQLQQAFIQQQPAFATLTQPPPHQQQPQQQQQQQQPQHATRMLQRALGTPSPTPAVLGRSGTPLSSSPSPGPNPLAIMAAAGALRQREGSASGATSPRYNSSIAGTAHTGQVGHHSRSSSHGCSQEMPPLHLLQLSDMHTGSRPGSPQRTPARPERLSSEGGGVGGTPPGHSAFSNGPSLQQGKAQVQGQPLAPTAMVVTGTAGPAMVTPLLLQRLDSLHRSGSSSGCSPRCLHRSSSPGLQSGEQSGQLLGLLVPGYCSGPASGPSSPRSHSPRHERHLHPQPAVVGAVHSLHRPGSSRLAIQGSYELPAAAAAVPVDAQGGSSNTPAAAMPPAGSAGSCGFAECTGSGQALPVYGVSVVHAPGAHVYHHQFPQAHPAMLQPSSRRAPSLLRIDSNSRDRAISPFAMASGGMGSDHGSTGAAGTGVGPAGAQQVAAAPAGTCSRTLSPFAAASSGGSSLEDVASRGNINDVVPAVSGASAAAAAAAAGRAVPATAGVSAAGLGAAAGAGAAAGRPPAPARYVSPFAAAAVRQEDDVDDGDTDAVFDTSAERSSRGASPAPGAGSKRPGSRTKAPAGGTTDVLPAAGAVGGAAVAASGSTSATRLTSPFALMQQQDQ